MDGLLKLIARFNTDIKLLCRIYVSKTKGTKKEEEAYRMQKRLGILIGADEIYLIKKVGPYLLKYGDLIKNKDWDSLVNQEYKSEVQDMTNEGDVTDDEAMDAIITIKSIFNGSTDDEKSKIGEVIEDMLSVYCQYALFVKNNNI
jgi:hypothetical protein